MHHLEILGMIMDYLSQYMVQHQISQVKILQIHVQ